MNYGLEGSQAGTYTNNNLLRFRYLDDGTPVSQLSSPALANQPILPCGQGFFSALALDQFPAANEIELRMTKADQSDPILCVARFRD